jgi:hypothetical protein
MGVAARGPVNWGASTWCRAETYPAHVQPAEENGSRRLAPAIRPQRGILTERE